MSAVLHDDPRSPREIASYWIEHVIKHGGKHLRFVAMDTPLYQFLMIDVIAFVFIILLLFTILTSLLIVFVVRKTCWNRSVTKDKIKKQ